MLGMDLSDYVVVFIDGILGDFWFMRCLGVGVVSDIIILFIIIALIWTFNNPILNLELVTARLTCHLKIETYRVSKEDIMGKFGVFVGSGTKI